MDFMETIEKIIDEEEAEEESRQRTVEEEDIGAEKDTARGGVTSMDVEMEKDVPQGVDETENVVMDGIQESQGIELMEGEGGVMDMSKEDVLVMDVKNEPGYFWMKESSPLAQKKKRSRLSNLLSQFSKKAEDSNDEGFYIQIPDGLRGQSVSVEIDRSLLPESLTSSTFELHQVEKQHVQIDKLIPVKISEIAQQVPISLEVCAVCKYEDLYTSDDLRQLTDQELQYVAAKYESEEKQMCSSHYMKVGSVNLTKLNFNCSVSRSWPG